MGNDMPGGGQHNPETKATRPSLLLRIRDFRDGESWQQFVDLYRPMIIRYLRGIGVGEDDALDLAQEVLQIVLRRIHAFAYDPLVGKFRGWLRKVTVNRARRHFLEKRRQFLSPGGTGVHQALQQVPDASGDMDEHWERQWRTRCLEVAMEKVRPQVEESTWQSFRMAVLENQPPKVVAEKLKISVGLVYVNKSRVLARLRKAVETINE